MATNPFDKVYLSKSQLDTLANGGTITSGVDTYIADETALYLTDEKITEEDLDQSLQEKINAAGGFETLVGTTDTPINLVTDITLNKFYIISGNCSISDYAFIVENAHLCSKVPNSDIDGDALYIYNSSIIIPTEETETLKITDGTGTFLIGIESTGSPTIPSLVNAVNLFNGSAFSQHAVSFYAPTTAGTSGSFLQSNGEGAEPTWVDNTAPFVLDITDLTAKISDDNLTKLQNNKVAYIRYSITDTSFGTTTDTYLYRKVHSNDTDVIGDENANSILFALSSDTAGDISKTSKYLRVFIEANSSGLETVAKGTVKEVTQNSLVTPSGTPTDGQVPVVKDNKLTWADMPIGKTKYYRHYVQLAADNKALYYDFSSTQETAYTADTLPSMPDDIITTFQVVANDYYSTVSGLVYRNSENELKVIMHGMYTTDGTNMTYLQLTGTAATFVQDVVKTM